MPHRLGLGPSTAGGGAAPLTGRASQRGALLSALARAGTGECVLVVVEGEPGFGKTALVRDLVASGGADRRVLVVSGEASEHRIDYGVVDQLHDEAGAVGLGAPAPIGRSGVRPDPAEVGAGLVELFAGASPERPLVVVVDDAQWADRPSLQALTYALRRSRRRAILAVVLHRSDAAEVEPLHRLCRDTSGIHLRLPGLTVTELRSLVAERTGANLSERAAGRLHAHTRGSPLESMLLVDEMDLDDLQTGLGPLPAPRSFGTLVLGRLATASTAAERVVGALAVLGVPTPVGTLVRMLGGHDLADAMDEARALGFLAVEVRGGSTVVEVAHPLMAAAVLFDLEPGRRARLHRQAATVTADPARAMLHRLRSVLGEDHELAAEAVALARDRLDQGWELTALELLAVAADLFGPGPRRTEARLLAADRLLSVASDVAGATALVADLAPGSGGPLDDLVRGQLAFHTGDPRTARALLRRAWEDPSDHRTGARAAGLLATTLANTGHGDRSLTWARRALERSVRAAPDIGHALSMVASARALNGDLAGGRTEVEWWLARVEPGEVSYDGLLARGLLALWSGELEPAAATFEQVLAAGPGRVDSLTLATAGYSLADALHRSGDWDRALELSSQLATTLDDAERFLPSPMAHGVAASVLAGRGQVDEARAHLAAGSSALARAGNPAGGLWLTVGEARVGRAEGRWDVVVDTLAPLAALLDQVGLPEGVQPWRADLVEALVAIENLPDAHRALDRLEQRVGAGHPTGADHDRVRALVAAAAGDEESAASAFAHGLARPAEEVGRFARARLEAAAGAFERRRGRRRVAAGLLGAATAGFGDLAARPDLDRAERELAACGLSARRGPDRDPTELTPAEETVAALVASGLSNRRVAAELVISIKTVESHLARVFAKVGVRSRAELAARWRSDDHGRRDARTPAP